MRYRVILPKSVQKELDRLSDDVANRILTRLTDLETNPRPPVPLCVSSNPCSGSL
jgi:mRNA-degrading endonuclease RelE of RelBE toxin-antitoxin system